MEVAGDAERSIYDLSGLLLLLNVEPSDGSLKRSFSGVALGSGRSCARWFRTIKLSLGTRETRLGGE